VPAARIGPKREILVTVKIKGRSTIPGVPDMDIDQELIADSGSPTTLVDWRNIAPFFDHMSATMGQVLKTNFGLILQIFDLTMEVEVEDHGGGNAEIRQCPYMSAHFVSDDVPAFTPATGLLGMDQFDTIQADPVKSADGTRAYLAKRV